MYVCVYKNTVTHAYRTNIEDITHMSYIQQPYLHIISEYYITTLQHRRYIIRRNKYLKTIYLLCIFSEYLQIPCECLFIYTLMLIHQ